MAWFSAILSQQKRHSLLKWWSFYFFVWLKSKTYLFQRIYSQTYLDNKFVLFSSVQHFGWSCSVWAKIKNNGSVQICWIVKFKAFYAYKKKFSIKYIGFVWIKMQAKISSCCKFCKANVAHLKNCRDNMGTWTKPSSSCSNHITMSDSDNSHISFLWEIAFTKMCKKFWDVPQVKSYLVIWFSFLWIKAFWW